jgi:hypothetical protein
MEGSGSSATQGDLVLGREPRALSPGAVDESAMAAAGVGDEVRVAVFFRAGMLKS